MFKLYRHLCIFLQIFFMFTLLNILKYTVSQAVRGKVGIFLQLPGRGFKTRNISQH